MDQILIISLNYQPNDLIIIVRFNANLAFSVINQRNWLSDGFLLLILKALTWHIYPQMAQNCTLTYSEVHISGFNLTTSSHYGYQIDIMF